MTPDELATLRTRFLDGMQQADRNASIMFGITLLAVFAWYALNYLPSKWQPFARLVAWCYVFVALAITALYG